MRMRLLVALAAGLMVGAAPAPDLGDAVQVIPPGSKWVWNGDDGLSLSYEFEKGGVCRISSSGKLVWTVSVKYSLTPTASPARIDMSDFQNWCPGIYRLKGDRLFLCFSALGERPVTFADRRKAKITFLILKRVK